MANQPDLISTIIFTPLQETSITAFALMPNPVSKTVLTSRSLRLPSANRNFLYPLLVGEGFFEVGEGLGVRAELGDII
jgi:hypothetical protein